MAPLLAAAAVFAVCGHYDRHHHLVLQPCRPGQVTPGTLTIDPGGKPPVYTGPAPAVSMVPDWAISDGPGCNWHGAGRSTAVLCAAGPIPLVKKGG